MNLNSTNTMNQKVEEFLAKAKAAEKQQAEKEKRRVLISAGLYEKETTYSDKYTDQCPYYDNEKRQYYGTKKNPVEVTEEEYAEILKYTKAQKENEEEEILREAPINDGAEKTLNSIATLTLVCGIIAAIICFATLCFHKVPAAGYTYITETKFDPAGLGIAISVLIVSIATWAMMKVFANISLTLNELNSKIKK